LYGAKIAGMKTIFTEYLESKSEFLKEPIMINADFHVNSFDEILNYMD
jgi:putative hydrolase of the HAD superfamily